MTVTAVSGSNDHAFTIAFPAQASAGKYAVTFSVALDTAGMQSVTAADTAGAGLTAMESGILVSPASAARLEIRLQPSATAATGRAFAVQPVIEEVDVFGNLETGDDSAVVSAALAQGAGPLRGTSSATVSGGLATFAGLTDDTVPTP